jgi:hypothetical protein
MIQRLGETLLRALSPNTCFEVLRPWEAYCEVFVETRTRSQDSKRWAHRTSSLTILAFDMGAYVVRHRRKQESPK